MQNNDEDQKALFMEQLSRQGLEGTSLHPGPGHRRLQHPGGRMSGKRLFSSISWELLSLL